MLNVDLTGKTALVCGSSQGIGKACAEQLASLGANVTLFARNLDKLRQVKSGLSTEKGQEHFEICADFTQPDQVKRALADHLKIVPKFNILVNNTGGPTPGPAHLANTQAFIDAFNLHLINNHQIVELLLPEMKTLGFGRIINVISTSVKQPLPNLGVSNTIRGAVANWAKTLANELGQYQITVNNVLPGATNTERLDAIIKNKANKQNKSIEEVIEEEKSIIPLGRFGEPEEFAQAVAFLASPAANYITGVNLPIDGGRTACL